VFKRGPYAAVAIGHPSVLLFRRLGRILDENFNCLSGLGPIDSLRDGSKGLDPTKQHDADNRDCPIFENVMFSHVLLSVKCP
jgi:hypothetical protein